MKKMIVLLLVCMAVLPIQVSGSTNSETIISDTSLSVYGPLNEYKPVNDPAWGDPHPAVETWVHPAWPTLDPAKWISNTYLIEGNISGDTWRHFRKTVDLCENAYNISGVITANSDNSEEVYVNGAFVGSDGNFATFIDYPYQAVGDTLVFDFIVRNYPGMNNPYANPTGLIFSASLNYSCPLQVSIDIKPGSFPSCFNNNGKGLIPVAIFGSSSFNVHDVNVSTVRLEGLPVALRPDGRYIAAYQDVNSDGITDLVVKFIDEEGVFSPGDEFATLTGNLMDGTPFYGVGDICITR